jgi:hypothetical protein
MEANDKRRAAEELAAKKRKTEHEIDDLRDLKNRVDKAESDMRNDSAKIFLSLNRLEEALACRHISVGDLIERIRQQSKEYNESPHDQVEDYSSVLGKRIAELEDELEGIVREKSLLER